MLVSGVEEGNGTPLQCSCLENPRDVHWRRKWQPTRVLAWRIPGMYIGEGNGNPLQCSCLENPREGGAWWAAVYGVAQSRTQLKRLSSGSSSSFRCTAKWISYTCIHSFLDSFPIEASTEYWEEFPVPYSGSLTRTSFMYSSGHMGLPRWLTVKNPPAGATGDPGSTHGSGRSPRWRHGNPFQYSRLENSMDRGAWWATVHWVPQSWTWLKRLSTHTHTHTHTHIQCVHVNPHLPV